MVMISERWDDEDADCIELDKGDYSEEAGFVYDVRRFDTLAGTVWSVKELYHFPDGQLANTDNNVSVFAESKDDLKVILERMLEAINIGRYSYIGTSPPNLNRLDELERYAAERNGPT
jgi:hypothetical protein